MVRKVIPLLLAPLLVSCQQEEILTIDDYWAAREDCGIEQGEFIPIPSGESEAYVHVQQDCAARIGDDAGINWATFEETPHRIAFPETDGELVVSGLYTILSSDVGNLGELRERDMPSKLREDLETISIEAGIEDSDPAGAFWWLYYRRWAEFVFFDAACDIRATAYYSGAFDNTVAICGFEDEANKVASKAASVMIHETSHGPYPGHEIGGNKDYTPEGAYGVELRWVSDWLVYNMGHVSNEDCEIVEFNLEWHCIGIDDPGDYQPCVDPPQCPSE